MAEDLSRAIVMAADQMEQKEYIIPVAVLYVVDGKRFELRFTGEAGASSSYFDYVEDAMKYADDFFTPMPVVGKGSEMYSIIKSAYQMVSNRQVVMVFKWKEKK